MQEKNPRTKLCESSGSYFILIANTTQVSSHLCIGVLSVPRPFHVHPPRTRTLKKGLTKHDIRTNALACFPGYICTCILEGEADFKLKHIKQVEVGGVMIRLQSICIYTI